MADDQRLLDATDTRPRQPSLGLSLGRGRRVTSSATTGLTSAVVAVAAIARGSGRDVAEARIESSIEQLSVAKDKAHTSSPRDEQQPSSATGACDIHKTWTVALTTPATTPAAIATSLDFFVTTLKTKHARNVPERLRFECWSYVKRNATRMSAMTNDLSPFTVNPCKCLEVVALLTDDGRCILPMELEVLPVLQRWFSMCDERELAHNEQESAHNEQLQEVGGAAVAHSDSLAES